MTYGSNEDDNFPLRVKEFLDTCDGKAFMKKQSKRACFIVVLIYLALAKLMLIAFSLGKVNYLNPKRHFIFICFCVGMILAQISAKALYHQIVLGKLYNRLELPKEEQTPMPFQTLKIRVITGLYALMMIFVIIDSLVP